MDSVIEDLKKEGVCVAAYINPYLNVKGDIYKQNENEKFWLTNESGESLIQDFGQFDVSIAVRSHLPHSLAIIYLGLVQ